ncbi:MAG: M48 family metalloprotease [Verrucomicrobia bacterium]|nr:M48 family metalloprotease [Verrucomicrobiota bacterium]
MNNNPFARCDCESCGNPIEYPEESAGMNADCPHCGAQTALGYSAISEPVAEAHAIPAVEILNAFEGTITPARVSFFYQVGLLLVSCMMVLLPLVYVALVCLAGWGVYLYATHFSFLLTMGGGFRGAILKLMIYGGPLFIGIILVLFMVKPLFARRPRHAQPMALNPAFQPTVYAFIGKICDLVGAPMPKRIDMDCELNASASFRRGMGSLFGNDLVLTIGLPLVAGLSVREFAGVIAHEFGHFTQGFGMRLSYIIRSVNMWFARVVYERDAFDVWLQETSEEAEDWRWAILVGCARIGVWCSRQILKLLMLTGHGVSCFLLRQMEYDADSYETKLSGSETFESTSRRMHVLNTLLKPTYDSMRASWNSGRELPNDLPALLLKQDQAMPIGKRTQVEDSIGLNTTGIFDTHPSAGDRIRCARQMNEPGIFHLDAPATILFQNFDIISQQVTQLHYSDDLGIPVELAKLVPVQSEKAEEPEETPPASASSARSAGPVRLRLPNRSK